MTKITVHIPGINKRRRSIGLLHLVAGFFFIANADRVYQLDPQNGYLPLVPLILIAAISLIYGALQKRIDPLAKYNFSLRLAQAFGFFGYAAAFVASGNGDRSLGFFLWVIIALMLAFSERVALQEQNVAFSDRGFDFPAGYRRKHVSWQLIANITLRSDFLTIHYKDNRFLQFELAHPVPDAAAASLQHFCSTHTNGNVAAS